MIVMMILNVTDTGIFILVCYMQYLLTSCCLDELDTYNFVDSEEEHYTVDDDDDGYGNDQF